MKHLAWLFLPLLLSACGPASSGTTPDAYAVALQNVQAQSTLEAMRASSQAISANLTAVAFIPTQEAIATGTERAWTMVGWTATAAVEQTATAASGTATQQSIEATATQRAADITATVESAAASAKATALYGESVSVELAIERERMMNKVTAAAPWTLLIILFVFCLMLVYRWSKIRIIQRDARGDAPLLTFKDGIYDPDRNPYPLLDYSGKKPAIPALTSPEIQAATTSRDQMIDLVTRGIQGQSNPQRKTIAQQMAAKNILPAPVNVEVISPEQARPLLGNAINGIIRDAIDVDIINDEKGDQHD